MSTKLGDFLDVLNKSSMFKLDLTAMIAPLSKLLQKIVIWTWGEEQQNALENIKHGS